MLPAASHFKELVNPPGATVAVSTDHIGLKQGLSTHFMSSLSLVDHENVLHVSK